MTIETHATIEQNFSTDGHGIANPGEMPLGANLAALLDRFTQSVMAPHDHVIGDFSSTVQGLHGELTMLAHHFAARAHAQELDELDFDDIFPGETNIPVDLDPAYHGIMAAEELEHHCRLLCR